MGQTDCRSVRNQFIVIVILLCVPTESASVNLKGIALGLRLLLPIKTRRLLPPTVTAVLNQKPQKDLPDKPGPLDNLNAPKRNADYVATMLKMFS